MRFTISLLAAVVLAIQANAQQIIAFSGDTCNGGQGGEVPCDGTCFDFTGRHSYEVSSADFLNQGNADVDYRFLVLRQLSPSSRAAIALDRSLPLAPTPLASASMSTQAPPSVRSVAPGLER